MENPFHKQFKEGDELGMEIYSPNLAWEDMKERLDDRKPETAVIIPAKKRKKKIHSLLLFLLFALCVLLAIILTNKTGDNNALQYTDSDSLDIQSEKNIAGNATGDNYTSATQPLTGNKKNTVNDTTGNFREKPAKPFIAGKNAAFRLNQEFQEKPVTKSWSPLPGNGVKGDQRPGKEKILAIPDNAESNIYGIIKLKPGIEYSTDRLMAVNVRLAKISPGFYNAAAGYDDISDSMLTEKMPVSLKVLLEAIEKQGSSEKSTDRKTKTIFQAGLSWELQVPVFKMRNYFTDANTNQTPEKLLLPGVWVSIQKGRSMFSAAFDPFYSVTLSDRPFLTESISNTFNDTIYSTIVNRSLNNLYGISAKTGYGYNITGNWWAGSSLQWNHWKKAIGFNQDFKSNQSVSTGEINYSTYSWSYPVTDSTGPVYEKNQFNVDVDLLYQRPLWQINLQAGIPLTSLSKQIHIHNPLYIALQFRFTMSGLLGRKK